MWLHAREEVVTWLGNSTKHLVDLQLFELSTLLGHVVHSLEEELEEVRSQVDLLVAMELDHSQLCQLGHQDHDPVVVRLQLSLVDSTNTEHFQRVTKLVDIFVEESEVEELIKVMKHELEAELVEQVTPVKGHFVFFVD